MTKPCKLWTGALDSSGYGLKWVDGKLQKVHRLAFKESYGAFPVNKCLHTCDTPACYEPTHLYDGTTQQNRVDRQERGERSQYLNRKSVLEAKRLLELGVPGKLIAQELGISRSTVSRIKTQKTWTHVTS